MMSFPVINGSASPLAQDDIWNLLESQLALQHRFVRSLILMAGF